jgi:hypothetical protein
VSSPSATSREPSRRQGKCTMASAMCSSTAPNTRRSVAWSTRVGERTLALRRDTSTASEGSCRYKSTRIPPPSRRPAPTSYEKDGGSTGSSPFATSRASLPERLVGGGRQAALHACLPASSYTEASKPSSFCSPVARLSLRILSRPSAIHMPTPRNQIRRSYPAALEALRYGHRTDKRRYPSHRSWGAAPRPRRGRRIRTMSGSCLPQSARCRPLAGHRRPQPCGAER